MRIAILTTDTIHHRYFLKDLEAKLGPEDSIVLTIFEGDSYPWKKFAIRYFKQKAPNIWNGIFENPYIRIAWFEQKKINYELKSFFGDNGVPESSHTYPSISVDSINSLRAIELLKEFSPDIGVVYGTSKINREVFSCPRKGMINCHGGLLPEFRGLDTNLWSCAQGHPEKMAVTIHEISDGLDTGDILRIERVLPKKGLDIFSLRFHTTLICVDAVLSILSDIRLGVACGQSQSLKSGSYYGPMPILRQILANIRLKRYAALAAQESA